MSRNSILGCLALLPFLVTPTNAQTRQPPVHAAYWLQPDPDGGAGTPGLSDPDYRAGLSNLDNCKWQKAAEAFARCALRSGEEASGALYWKAYAENRGGHPQRALATLASLQRKFPQCNWAREARALEVEIQSKTRRPLDPAVHRDAHLKLIVVEGMMQSNATEAIPTLAYLLSSDNPAGIKERALFLLATTGSTECRDLIKQVASNNPDDNIRLRAIEYTGIVEGDQSRQELLARYQADTDIRPQWNLMERPPSAADIERMWQLFQAANTSKDKQSVLNTMLLAGKPEPLLKVASSNAGISLRIYAIHALGIIRNQGQTQRLATVFRVDRNSEIRSAILQTLCMQKDENTLHALAKTESDPAVRRRIAGALSSSFPITQVSANVREPVQ